MESSHRASGEVGVLGTVAGEAGSVVCECNHLTDFVVFEFPTSLDDLADDVLSGFTGINGLSEEAFQCLTHPSPSEHSFIWSIIGLVVGIAVVGLWRASERDRAQIDMIQLLVQGRKREREQHLRSTAAAAFQAVTRRGVAASSEAKHDGPAPKCKTLAANGTAGMEGRLGRPPMRAIRTKI